MSEVVTKKKKDKALSKIVLNYDDGTEKVLDKGFVAEISKNDVKMEFANISGPESIDFFNTMLIGCANILGLDKE